MTDLHDKARAWFDSPRANDAEPTAIIAALLAENERLTLALDGSRHAVSYWTEQHAAAEARLKAMCEAEPLMLLHTGKIHDDDEQDDWDSEADSGKRIDAYCRKHPGQTIALIPRPSMEVGK